MKKNEKQLFAMLLTMGLAVTGCSGSAESGTTAAQPSGGKTTQAESTTEVAKNLERNDEL